MSRRQADPEHQHQCTVVSFIHLSWPKLAGCLIASMNGAALSGNKLQRAKQMARHKRAGMKVGASDLFWAVPRGAYHGLHIEMKDQGKTASSVTDDQADHLILMRDQGYMAVWCAGADAAMTVIENYMKLPVWPSGLAQQKESPN